ncbi:unnamed protein product [Vitrella brassicaformis CCMP3155]|uniref:Exoribonuclease phosphorolytic domain-containing protein n=1 Tax=Vitrella brassicaformis (strain CCMP3155) TaxID=1169540 RepID=A0A0G4G1E2_VITBC|nr:unnamed protein product [Vitrella brassicaformis CCMP3155]|eukprot:CEM21890.1 unnamed protein product [Vitrella brassicaformis CCMP3155]
MDAATYRPLPPDVPPAPTVSFGAAERSDGRTNEDVRDIEMQTGPISSAVGSAFFQIGKTKALSAVYGPRQSMRQARTSSSGAVNIDLKFAPFAVPSRTSMAERERYLVGMLSEAFESIILVERYAKSVIDITCIVLEDDGGVLSACFNAISLAAAHAGLEMTDIVTATSLYCMEVPSDTSQNVVYLSDLTAAEEACWLSSGQCTEMHVGIATSGSSICFLHGTGSLLNPTCAEQLLGRAEEICRAIGKEMRACLKAAYAASQNAAPAKTTATE